MMRLGLRRCVSSVSASPPPMLLAPPLSKTEPAATPRAARGIAAAMDSIATDIVREARGQRYAQSSQHALFLHGTLFCPLRLFVPDSILSACSRFASAAPSSRQLASSWVGLGTQLPSALRSTGDGERAPPRRRRRFQGFMGEPLLTARSGLTAGYWRPVSVAASG